MGSGDSNRASGDTKQTYQVKRVFKVRCRVAGAGCRVQGIYLSNTSGPFRVQGLGFRV